MLEFQAHICWVITVDYKVKLGQVKSEFNMKSQKLTRSVRASILSMFAIKSYSVQHYKLFQCKNSKHQSEITFWTINDFQNGVNCNFCFKKAIWKGGWSICKQELMRDIMHQYKRGEERSLGHIFQWKKSFSSMNKKGKQQENHLGNYDHFFGARDIKSTCIS